MQASGIYDSTGRWGQFSGNQPIYHFLVKFCKISRPTLTLCGIFATTLGSCNYLGFPASPDFDDKLRILITFQRLSTKTSENFTEHLRNDTKKLHVLNLERCKLPKNPAKSNFSCKRRLRHSRERTLQTLGNLHPNPDLLWVKLTALGDVESCTTLCARMPLMIWGVSTSAVALLTRRQPHSWLQVVLPGAPNVPGTRS